MPINAAKHIWYNGKLVPWEKATVHVLAHALHYGSTVFEGERAYPTPNGPVIFRLKDHTRRLFDSAKIYSIEIPYTQEQISAACKEIINVNGLTKGAYLRPFAFRSYGEIGVAPKIYPPIDTVVAAFEWGSYLGSEGLENGVDVHGVVLAAPGTEHDSRAGQGSRQLLVEPADQHGSQAAGLCSKASASASDGTRQRRRWAKTCS